MVHTSKRHMILGQGGVAEQYSSTYILNSKTIRDNMVWWVGHQVSTNFTPSLPLLSWTGERKYNERLMDRGKNREITHQVLS